jgi:hypothetical protein
MEETSTLTFLNTTGTAGLSRDSARLVRGHVTKRNFAKRRARAADVRLGSILAVNDGDGRQASDQRALARKPLALSLSRDIPRILASNDFNTMPSMWSLFFVDSGGSTTESCRESTWLQFVTAEPVFKEATLSVGLRHYSPDACWERKAAALFRRVIQALLTRIQQGKAYTDGTIAAIVTLAFGERLVFNDAAWNVHANGVAQIATERRSRGLQPLPDWISSLVISDSVNHILKYPRVYHEAIIDAVGPYGNESLYKVADMANRIVLLRGSIGKYKILSLGQEYADKHIEEPAQQLRDEAKKLCNHKDADVRATMRSMLILLQLSWPSTHGPSLATLACELRDALCQRLLHCCLYADLTSGQFIMGAIAAEGDPEVRDWFVGRWKRAVEAMGHRGWSNPVNMIERGLRYDPDLLQRFRVIWDELDV